MLEARVQRAMSALERKDVRAIMDGWSEGGVLTIGGHSSISRSYTGKAEIEAFFRGLVDRMSELHITVRRVAFANPLTLTYSNTVFVEYELDEVVADGSSLHGHCVATLEYRRGRVVAMREWWWDPSILETIWGPAGETASG